MSTATTTLLAAFEGLPDSEKQQFVNAVCRRLPPVDSGPLDDELVAQAGDDLAALLTLESTRRRDEVRSGNVTPIPATEVYRRIESLLAM